MRVQLHLMKDKMSWLYCTLMFWELLVVKVEKPKFPVAQFFCRSYVFYKLKLNSHFNSLFTFGSPYERFFGHKNTKKLSKPIMHGGMRERVKFDIDLFNTIERWQTHEIYWLSSIAWNINIAFVGISIHSFTPQSHFSFDPMFHLLLRLSFERPFQIILSNVMLFLMKKTANVCFHFVYPENTVQTFEFAK